MVKNLKQNDCYEEGCTVSGAIGGLISIIGSTGPWGAHLPIGGNCVLIEVIIAILSMV